MIRGETVTVSLLELGDDDRLGIKAHTHAEPVAVPNVVVVPSTMDDAAYQRPDGVRIVYTLHFPRGYSADLRGALVTVRGDVCKVVGEPRSYTESNVRGPWTMPVQVAMSDG